MCVCRIIVGAPNAQTDQENVYRGGAVYRCHVEHQHCEPIPFDVQGESIQSDMFGLYLYLSCLINLNTVNF